MSRQQSPLLDPPGSPARAVLFHSLDQARFALTCAHENHLPVILLTAPGAGAYLGAGWFLAVLAELRLAFPEIDKLAWLDCDDAAGHALSALKAGCQQIVFTGPDQVTETLSGVALDLQATLQQDRPPTFDLQQLDLPNRNSAGLRNAQEKLLAWLDTDAPASAIAP